MTKLKPIQPRWFLQSLADTEVARLAPGWPITPCIQHWDEQIVWDQECEGVGRAPWSCGYFLPPDNPSARALVPILNAAIARWQEKYDLGLTCEGERR